MNRINPNDPNLLAELQAKAGKGHHKQCRNDQPQPTKNADGTPLTPEQQAALAKAAELRNQQIAEVNRQTLVNTGVPAWKQVLIDAGLKPYDISASRANKIGHTARHIHGLCKGALPSEALNAAKASAIYTKALQSPDMVASVTTATQAFDTAFADASVQEVDKDVRFI